MKKRKGKKNIPQKGSKEYDEQMKIVCDEVARANQEHLEKHSRKNLIESFFLNDLKREMQDIIPRREIYLTFFGDHKYHKHKLLLNELEISFVKNYIEVANNNNELGPIILEENR